MKPQPQAGLPEYTASGAGPAVLLLHGAMGGCDQSRILGQAALGGRGYRALAVSRPGYLGSPLALGRSPEQQADLCAAVLDAEGVAEATVIAVSGGGQCALQFALRHPARCRVLVLISACSAQMNVAIPLRFHLLRLMARLPALAGYIGRRAAADPRRGAKRAIPDAALRVRTLNHPEAWPLLRELQMSTMDRMAERMPGTANDIEQSRAPFDYPLERIQAPLLAIHGTADPVAPFSMAEALPRRVPGAELFAIEGGEHVALFTHMDEIRARIGRFCLKHRALSG